MKKIGNEKIKNKLEIINEKIDKKFNKNKIKKTAVLALVAMLALGRYTTEATLLNAYASSIATEISTTTTTSKATSKANSSGQANSTSDAKGGPGGPPPSGNPPTGNPPSGNPPAAPPNGGQGGPGGTSSKDIKYTASTKITSRTTQTGKKYTSSTKDKSALLVSTKDKVTINKPTVNKTGNSDGGDNSNFYGLNAGVLVKDGSTTTIKGGRITTNASGANGVFSYGGNGGNNGAKGDGTKVVISDTKIVTKGDGSGGIMTTGGGETYASNLDVTTSGQSSAAIRTDRGGGTVVVKGGTYTSNGLGSPAIYSTANIKVSNAKLTSNLSEGVCIEGLNSITLNKTNLTANNTKRNGNATFLDTIMIYQSMSGDSASGTSKFTANGGSITSKSGHVFHVTNTNAVISLNNVKIKNTEDRKSVV